MWNGIGLALNVAVLAALMWLIAQLRAIVSTSRTAEEQRRRDAQRLFDLLTVRLPEPTLSDVKAEAHREARVRAGRTRAIALHAFHRAASRLGAEWSSDIDDENLTVTDVGELERHFRAASLVESGLDPKEAAQRELLGRDCLGATEEELAALSVSQRKRAERLAETFSRRDLSEVEGRLEEELIKKGALRKGAVPSAAELEAANFAFLVAAAVSCQPAQRPDHFTGLDALYMKQLHDRFGEIPPPPSAEDLAKLSDEDIGRARRLAKELARVRLEETF